MVPHTRESPRKLWRGLRAMCAQVLSVEQSQTGGPLLWSGRRSQNANLLCEGRRHDAFHDLRVRSGPRHPNKLRRCSPKLTRLSIGTY